MSTDEQDEEETEVSGSYTTYLEYNRALRTWFVAFGIGGPVVFLVEDQVAARLSELGKLYSVALLFLIGASAQVIGALINKISNWYVYFGNVDSDLNGRWQHKAAEWVVGQFWIDILLDLCTIGAFGYALWTLLAIYR